MAVIRQQTQFLNKPVGVVRADAGAEQVGNAIAETAGRFADIAFKRAAADAEKKGTEKALAIESGDLIKMDPITNKPVALTPPSAYGDIAAEAYQNIIQKRYGQAIEREIQNKGAELAKTAPNANAFKKAMSEYVGSMYNAEADSTYYSNVVKEYGDDYVEKTYTTLRNKEITAYRAKVKREARLENVKTALNLNARVAAGEVSPELEKDLQGWMISNRDSYISGAGTISDVTDAYDMWKTFNALKSSSNLLGTYQSSNDSFQESIKLALRDPTRAVEYVGESMAKDIRTYLMNGGTGDSFIKTAEAQESTMANKIDFDAMEFAESNPVDASWDYNKTKQIYRDQPKKYLTEAMADLVMLKIDPQMTKDSIPTFIDELLAPDFKGENFPESVRAILQDMGKDERAAIAEVFNQRKIAKSAVSEVASEKQVNATAAALLKVENMDYSDSIEFWGAINDAKAEIEKLPEKDRASRIESLEASVATKINTGTRGFGLASDEMSDVHSLVERNQFILPPKRPNGEEWSVGGIGAKRYLAVLEKAYKFSPTSTVASMSRRAEKLRADEIKGVNAKVLEDVQKRISEGQPVTTDDLKLAGDIEYGNTIPKIDALVGDDDFLNRASSGNIYPQELKSLELALQAGEEVTQELGFNLFKQLKNVQQEIDGVVQSRNFLINKLPEDLYKNATAAIDASDFAMSFGRNLNPAIVYSTLQGYDGSINTAIREKLDIPANQPMNAIFEKYEIPEMDVTTQRQFLAMIQYSAASGLPLNEASIQSMVKTMEQNMVKDKRILGARIGEKTNFSPNGIIDDAGQRRMTTEIFQKIMSDPVTKEYLGLTALEEQAVAGGIPLEMYGKFSNNIFLEPLEETWISGKNRSWVVMMGDGFGGYVAPQPNNEVIIISEQNYKPNPTERDLFYYKNQMVAATHSGNRRAEAAAEFKYFVFRDIESFDTFESTANIIGIDKYKQYLSDQQLKDLYNEVVNGQ